MVALAETGLTITRAAEPVLVWPYETLAVDVPLTRGRRRAVVFRRHDVPATVVIADNAALRELARRAPHLTLRQERWRTLKPGLAAGVAAAALVAVVYAFDLSPSRALARAMPESARAALGQNVVRTLPVKDVCVAPEGREVLAKIVARLLPDGPVTSADISVLDWSLVNALALPGKRIVLTRAIIEQAASAEELAGIIGHEAGHVASLDPEAGLVRSVGLWALVQMVFTGTPGALGNAGVVLAQLAYTRSAERDADSYALARMRAAKIDPKPMAGFFRRMMARNGGRVESGGAFGRPSDILRSHPSDQERVQRIEAAATYPADPIVTPAEFLTLKGICKRAR